MGAIFSSLGRTVTAGVVLLIIFIILAGLGTGSWVRGERSRVVGASCSAGCTCSPA